MNAFVEDVNLAVLRPESMKAVLKGNLRPDLLRDEVLPEIFAASVQAFPKRDLFRLNGTSLSYEQVNKKADQMARGLVAQGVGPGHIVGLWMARGVELLISQLAITKTGAAWLPFDADAPPERIAVCLEDAKASGLVTSEVCATRADVHCSVWTPSSLESLASEQPLFNPRTKGLTPDDPAYLIYTSGSTGTPKGIVISHRNICHFLRASNEIYQITSNDVVFQGASVAFDLSMEEIWIPYLVGASLVVATPEIMADLDHLPDILEREEVTVLDTVPTLLSLIGRDIPSLRLILLGGEALPAPLVEKWATPGRRVYNTYGPTEATVVATLTEVQPGDAVTIGRPLPNYTCYIVDDELQLLGANQQGELLIGGPGVARGYLARPDLTTEKFIPNHLDRSGHDPVLYRSGDAVSLTNTGQIAFHGRIDDQVKIRGFRVELGEIEVQLAHLPGISQAAVVLRRDNDIDRLVAFLVLQANTPFNEMELRSILRKQLPPYMVPSHFEDVQTLPRLTSGKIDRNALKKITLQPVHLEGVQEQPKDATEAVLLAAAKRAFGADLLPLEADFFADLGGHSLIAARFVSFVRESPALAAMTLQDVYEGRSLREMSKRLVERTGGADAQVEAKDLSFAPPSFTRRFLCGLAQLATLPLLISLATAQWLGIFLTYLLIVGELGLIYEIIALLSIAVMINIVTALIAIAGKWLVIGRTKPGRYPLWGVYYYRWWLSQRLATLVHIKWLQGSPAIRLYLRALGANIGKDVVFGDLEAGAIDLVSIKDDSTLGAKLTLANAEVIGNELVIGRITVGKDVMIGTSCVISHGCVIEDHAEILDLTALQPHTHVKQAEIWDGSPARHTGMADVANLPPQAYASARRRRVLNVLYAVALAGIPAISLLPIFPAFMIFDKIDDAISAYTEVNYLWYLPLLAWPTAMMMILGTVLLIVTVRWLILPRVTSGFSSIHSGFYMRKWVVALSTEVMLETLSSLYATIYMRIWYRMMGAGIGKAAEISTNLSGRYDLTEIGTKNFIADEVMFGDEEIRRGVMHLEPVRTGARVFVGNDAVVPPGATIPDDVLIGIKSKPPANEMMHSGETWFGSPPIRLPTRQKVELGSNWTYEPTFWRKFGRAAFEALHTSFPTMLFITFGTVCVDLLFYPAIEAKAWETLAIIFVIASVLISLLQTFIVIFIKWAMMGVYKPMMKPMWSWWAMRTEAVAVMYWGLAGKVLLEHLRGTPFLPMILRLFGCRMGKGVWLNTTDVTEFDCVSVGDFCTVNAHSALQTHLYEDRVMKVGRVHLGRGVTVGPNATVLYDTHIGDYARLSALTVVMKGESIPAHSKWAGAPAVPVVETKS